MYQFNLYHAHTNTSFVCHRWLATDHTGSFPELSQDVLPPPSPPERRCCILAGPGQGEQWWSLQRNTCGECQSAGQALPSIWASAGVPSLHHTGRPVGLEWVFLETAIKRIVFILRTCFLQIPSGYYIQTMNSNLHLGDQMLPIGVMNVISILPLLILAPLIELVTSCCLSFNKTPLAPAKVISEYFSVHTSASSHLVLMFSPKRPSASAAILSLFFLCPLL